MATAGTTAAALGGAPGVAGAPAQPSAVRWPETVRAGIIGLDGHYSEITSAARHVPSLRIVAAAESSDALLRQARRNPTLAAAKTYQDYRSMLDSEKLDVVGVCGQNGVRAAIVRECARRRIPIAAEKPLALSLEELRAIRKAVSAAGVPLTMLLPMRFYPAYQAMRALVQAGEIG
jgi:predicted dehydrogenase